jgi:hypothetical protein
MYCYRNSDLNKHSERYFKNGEYLLADGGYVLNSRTLIPYKQPEGEQLEFNRKISSARIIVEHVMGLLKGRWSSLRGLRVHLHKKEDTEKVNKWIITCLILHNMVTSFNDNCEDVFNEDEERGNEQEVLEVIEENGIELRERVKQILVENA